MKRVTIDRRLTLAIDRLLALDEHLFAQRASERAIAHRLAIHLDNQFPGWDVDCEYNRYGDALKILPLSEACRHLLRRTGAVSPDIIIHTRGREGPNLLAIEIKKAGQRGRSCDMEKLAGYIREYQYEFGLFLSFRVGAATKPRLRERILLPQVSLD